MCMSAVSAICAFLPDEGFVEAELLMWIASGKARVVGSAERGLAFVCEYDDLSYVQCLCVPPELRACGRGTALAAATTRPGRVTWAKVRADNVAAARAFSRAGFVRRDDVPAPLSSVAGTAYNSYEYDGRDRYQLGAYDLYAEVCALGNRIKALGFEVHVTALDRNPVGERGKRCDERGDD